jgi:hypothetical protein
MNFRTTGKTLASARQRIEEGRNSDLRRIERLIEALTEIDERARCRRMASFRRKLRPVIRRAHAVHDKLRRRWAS